MIIRDAVAADAERIVAIANHYIRNTTVSFNAVEKAQAPVTEDLAAQKAAGNPFYIADVAGQIVGYATYAQFRKGSGYARCMEHTILLDPDHCGRGAGRALMQALEDRARASGIASLIGGISAENADAIAFHVALGFEEVGRVAQAGYKFDRWIDLILLQKRLSPGNDTR